MVNIDKLTPEGLTVLRKFGYTGHRFRTTKPTTEHIPGLPGAEPTKVTRIKPQSIEQDFYEARQELLRCQDPELKLIQDEMNKLWTAWGEALPGTKQARDLNAKIRELDHQIIKFVRKLKS